jgi:hypothetical protein
MVHTQPILTVLCDGTPAFMNPPVIPAANINPKWILVTWLSTTDPT